MNPEPDKPEPDAEAQSKSADDAALTERAKAVAKEYAAALREIVRKLRKKLN